MRITRGNRGGVFVHLRPAILTREAAKEQAPEPLVTAANPPPAPPPAPTPPLRFIVLNGDFTDEDVAWKEALKVNEGDPEALGVALKASSVQQLYGVRHMKPEASAAPLAQGAEPRDAKVGPFRVEAELLNGRLAMLALAGGSAWEVQSGAPFASLVPDLPENLWHLPDLSALPGLAALGIGLSLLATSSLALAPLLAPVIGELKGEAEPDAS